MKFLNVGLLEIVFILLLILIVLGPKRAVKAAGDIGGWLRKVIQSKFWQDLISTSKEIQDIPKKLIDEVEIQRTLEALNRSTDEINQEIRSGSSDYASDEKEIEQGIYKGPNIPPERR